VLVLAFKVLVLAFKVLVLAFKVLVLEFKTAGPMTGLSFGVVLGPSTGLVSGLASFLYIINIRFEFEFKRGFNNVVYIDLIFFCLFSYFACITKWLQHPVP
jgi:hypothetical protein